MNKKKIVFWFLAICSTLGFSFGLMVRFSGQGSMLSFLGLGSRDMTGEFRDTLYRTANTRIESYSSDSLTIEDKEPTKMGYDDSMILFAKPSSWAVSDTPEKAADVKNPAQLIKNKKVAIVTTKLVSTLEDIGVDTNLEPMPSLSEMPGGSKKLDYGSLNMISAGKDLQKTRPITRQEAKKQAMDERRIAAAQRENSSTVQTAAKSLRLSAMNQLRAAARVGQIAGNSSDPDAASSLLGGSLGGGENISPALEAMANKGELGGVDEDATVSVTAQVLQSLGITTSGDGSSGGSSGGSGSSSGGSSGEAESVLSAGGWIISGGSLNSLLSSTLIDDGQSGCVICGTIDINLSDLLVGPSAPVGPTAKLDQTALSTTLSLADFQGLTSPVSLGSVSDGGSSNSGLSPNLSATPSVLGSGGASTNLSGGSSKSSSSSGSGGSASKSPSKPTPSSKPSTPSKK